MTIGGSFPGTGAYMSYTTDQLRKDNALAEYALSPEEEEITVIQAPVAPPVPPATSRRAPTSASSGGE